MKGVQMTENNSGPIFKFPMVEITYDEFLEKFAPIGSGDGPIGLDELPPGIDARYVWTMVDTDSGVGWVPVSGFRRVNRLGYWICRVPVPDGEEYSVIPDYEAEWEADQQAAFSDAMAARGEDFYASQVIQDAWKKWEAMNWEDRRMAFFQSPDTRKLLAELTEAAWQQWLIDAPARKADDET
jgi:hypothetical protein